VTRSRRHCPSRSRLAIDSPPRPAMNREKVASDRPISRQIEYRDRPEASTAARIWSLTVGIGRALMVERIASPLKSVKYTFDP